MTRRVVFSRVSSRQIGANYDWLAGRSRRVADRWRDALLAAIDALASDADRHPRADLGTAGRDFR